MGPDFSTTLDRPSKLTNRLRSWNTIIVTPWTKELLTVGLRCESTISGPSVRDRDTTGGPHTDERKRVWLSFRNLHKGNSRVDYFSPGESY